MDSGDAQEDQERRAEPEAQNRRPARVACSIPNGIELRVFDERRGEFGQTIMVPRPETVMLSGPDRGGKPVVTEVDPAFADAWFEQNRESPLLSSGVLHRVPDEDATEADEGEGQR